MEITRIPRGSAGYPGQLERCLGDRAPVMLTCIGNVDILSEEKVGLFCSTKCPGDVILKCYDMAQSLRDAGTVTISGFHTPMEKECLTILLRGTQPIIVCPARSIESMRIPTEWGQSLHDGRLLILSPFQDGQRRISSDKASFRNEFVTALADRVLVLHASPGSRTERLLPRLKEWGKENSLLGSMSQI